LPYVSTLADHVHSAELPDDIWHQGITLASMAHQLADAPLRRIFCSVPQVAAVLPLLEPHQPPLTLPRI
jgi:hypothetical protein